ncbi:MAG: ABC transporter permease [Acidobacteriota bacterium]|nr:MAG: ABC transporter permease [Acidobacteriota bacterium]
MKIWRLVIKEIGYRKVNFLLSLMAVAASVGLFTVFVTTGEGYRNETRKIQLGMGQNLRIIPLETRMDQFWSAGYSELTMPEEYVYRFAALDGYEYTHLTATLQQAIDLKGRRIILTGILPEVMPPGRNQPPIMFSVERGEVYVGSEVARFFDIQEGQGIDLEGRSFRVTRALSPTGSNDDIKVFGHLEDIQELLGLEDRINEITALECLCLIESGQTELDALALAEAQLAEILPEGKVLLLRGIADVRERQRAAMEGYLGLLTPLVILIGGISIGILTMLNVRERYEEIGILRAIGRGSWSIATLFLGRALLMGVLGAPIGFFLGGLIALHFGPQIFSLTSGALRLNFAWLALLIVLAPAFTAIAAFIPTARAVNWDPLTTLRDS